MAMGKSGVRNHRTWAMQMPQSWHQWAAGAGGGEEEGVGGTGRVQIPLGHSGEERGRRMTRLWTLCARMYPVQVPQYHQSWHGPICYSAFFLLFHLPLPHPSPSGFFGHSEGGKTSRDMQGMGCWLPCPALDNYSLPTLLGQDHFFHGV